MVRPLVFIVLLSLPTPALAQQRAVYTIDINYNAKTDPLEYELFLLNGILTVYQRDRIAYQSPKVDITVGEAVYHDVTQRYLRSDDYSETIEFDRHGALRHISIGSLRQYVELPSLRREIQFHGSTATYTVMKDSLLSTKEKKISSSTGNLWLSDKEWKSFPQ